MLKVALILSALFSMMSCDKPKATTTLFFDSLLEQQAVRLANNHAQLTKSGTLKEKRDEVTFTPDKTHWQKELDVFRQLDAFEKPAYRSAYTVEDGVNDPRSNLLIRSYTSSKKEIPVPELRFYYYGNFHELRKIEAVFSERNALFSTTRKLTLELEDVAGEPELKTYRVEGNQKMIGSDSVRFLIQSTIHHQ